MKYILASKSPRRMELLTQAGIDFEVIPSNIEEMMSGTSSKDIVLSLASQKAASVFDNYLKEHSQNTDAFTVIGADTIVVYQEEILGKPDDEEDAYNMLSMLADRTHQVYTGVCPISSIKDEKKIVSFYEKTDVTFYPISKEDLRLYTESGDCLDKAGAYGIQGPFAVHVKCINGDYNNVVGLPIARLYQELKKASAPCKYKRLIFE